MADDLTLGLYRLIKADLENITRYGELKPLAKRVFVSRVPFPAFGKAPYVVVTPGTETGDESLGVSRDLDVVAWLVSQVARDAHQQPDLLGGVGLFDGGTLIRGLRRALARVTPYKDPAIFGTAPYPAVSQATRDSILACHYIQTGPYEALRQPKLNVDDEAVPDEIHFARPVTFRYEMVEVA